MPVDNCAPIEPFPGGVFGGGQVEIDCASCFQSKLTPDPATIDQHSEAPVLGISTDPKQQRSPVALAAVLESTLMASMERFKEPDQNPNHSETADKEAAPFQLDFVSGVAGLRQRVGAVLAAVVWAPSCFFCLTKYSMSKLFLFKKNYIFMKLFHNLRI